MLDEGIARELARINLPVSAYTEFYWQIDLSNLFHFLQLRLHAHAQKEIRDYAKILADIAKSVAPTAYEAFEEHILYAIRFSASEMRAIKALLKGESNPLTGRALALFEQKMLESQS
jgi:thymidylate synthase (FAD)